MDPHSTDDLEKVEAVDDLLEEIWFFDNLLNRRTRVLRYCHSDPYPSSSNSPKPENPNIGSLSSMKKLQDDEGSVTHSLIRAPSLPPYVERREMERKEANSKKISKLNRQLSEKISIQDQRAVYVQKKEPMVQAKGRESYRRSRLTNQSSKSNLQRTQTLPSYIGRQDKDMIQDLESDARLSFLIREAVASSSEIIPPRQNASKATMQFSSISRQRPPRNSESETFKKTDAVKEMRRLYPCQRRLTKTLSNVETEESQGFKDLGFGFNKQDSSPSLQEKLERPYVPETRLAKSCAPPIPTWVDKDSTKNMKAQIKFWARVVATNVRQEC